jgi:hypothetical protein
VQYSSPSCKGVNLMRRKTRDKLHFKKSARRSRTRCPQIALSRNWTRQFVQNLDKNCLVQNLDKASFVQLKCPQVGHLSTNVPCPEFGQSPSPSCHALLKKNTNN